MMMMIHHAPDGYWTGQSREIGERDPVPPDWIMADAPPPVPSGKVAMWADGWIITDSPEPLLEDWPSLARVALRQSDLVAIRALKAGIAYPEAWQAYDDALRAIVNGAPGPLPEQPEYPE